jgi:hypothetical protein
VNDKPDPQMSISRWTRMVLLCLTVFVTDSRMAPV